MNKVILLDSNSLVYRAFYALQKSDLNCKGVPTGAVYGFISMLARLINDEKPTHIAAAFDLKGPTFRHEMYEDYKGTRKPMPDDLVVQVPILKKILTTMGIKILELSGYEADDVLGTIAKRFDEPTLVVTGDKDSFQLINDSTKIYYTKRGITQIEIYDENKLAEIGFTPQKVIDYKGLRGDVSDNIPGIAGIGEKTAKHLLEKYDTLENVLDNADNIKGKMGERIRDGKEIALFSKKLATIDTDIPIECKLEDIVFKYPLSGMVKDILSEYELYSLIKRFEFSDEGNEKFDVETKNIDNISNLKQVVNDNLDSNFTLYIEKDIKFSFDNKTQYVVVPSNDLFGELKYEDILRTIKPLIEANTKKILYDFKNLLHVLSEQNIKINGKIYDIMIMAHLVKGGKNYNNPKKVMLDFGFGDEINTAYFMELAEKLVKECEDLGLNHLYYDIELPLTKVLYDMEKTGIAVDKSVLEELSKNYTNELELLTKNIYKHAGETFNINSPKQLSEILFDKLHLPTKKSNRVKKSSSIDILLDLYDKHPIIPFIIRYRQLAKLQSTYVDGLLKVIDSDNRIHTIFNQTVTSTGRLSSTEPNMQNIPTRTAEGREIRRAFVAKDGYVLVCADYSQIELRLLAHFSGDENLIRAYKESRDIHASTASDIFGIPQNEVTANMRRDAKAVNFGIIYGISDFGLANNLSISASRAKKYIERYFETYPRVKEYMDNNVKTAQEHGYIKTYAGRIRALPELKSSKYMVREFGKRAAMNMPLQGTAADIIKIAMIEIEKQLKGLNAKILLQVHDELILEVKESETDKIINIVTDCMENAVKLSVPLTVNVKKGKNWFEAD